MPPAARHRRPSFRPAFSLVEVAVAVGLISVLLVSVMNTARGMALSRQRSADTTRAEWLAAQLAAEIVALPYHDPNNLGTGLGPVAAQLAPGNRSLFDDVGDYHNLNDAPPRTKAGTALAGFSHWSRTVSVEFLDLSTLAPTSTDQGLKRITITVLRGRDRLAQSVLIRSSALSPVGTPTIVTGTTTSIVGEVLSLLTGSSR